MKMLLFLLLLIISSPSTILIAMEREALQQQQFKPQAHEIVIQQGDNRFILPLQVALKAQFIKDAYGEFGLEKPIPVPEGINMPAIKELMNLFDKHKALRDKDLFEAIGRGFGAWQFTRKLLKNLDYLGFEEGIQLIAYFIAKNSAAYNLELLANELNYDLMLEIAKFYYLLYQQDLAFVQRGSEAQPVPIVDPQDVNFSWDDYRKYRPDLLAVDERGRLNLKGKRLNHIPVNAFQTQKIRFLSLRKNRLQYLDPSIFQGLSSIYSIDLSNNRLTDLDPRIFQGIPLTQLYLVNNPLKNLHPQIFQNLQRLESLSLTNTMLAQLPPTIFQGLTNLKFLNLDDNQLSTLDPAIFRDLPRGAQIDLGGNPVSKENLELLRAVGFAITPRQ